MTNVGDDTTRERSVLDHARGATLIHGGSTGPPDDNGRLGQREYPYSSATQMSHASARSRPPTIAYPLIAVIRTGLAFCNVSNATVDVAVGQIRAIEFTANRPGDWAFHCHKSHDTMNAMGHQVPNLIGVPQKDLAKRINKLVPDYMAIGSTGGPMGAMEMPLPENTLPMMTGNGPFGALEMGRMFTVAKVREGLGRNDYRDPGWFRHPKGTVAFEYTGDSPDS